MNRFAGKNVLLTGGSRGIGFATAKAFADEGATVLITGRSASVLEKAAVLGEKASGMKWDLNDIDSFKSKLSAAIERLGHIDILVNNAGVLTGKDNTHTFRDATVADFTAVMNVNLRAVFFLCQMVSAHMIERGICGHIVNICSNMGFRMVSNAPYGISKWAVRGLTLGLGRELARKGIIVNGIAPGPVTTEMMNFKLGQENYYPHIPIERYSTPEEIAESILFLAERSNIVGEILVADGGERLY